MPRSDLTDITVIMDRSGSMESIKTDAEGGLNAFIDKQKAEPGQALFTLVEFDHEYEFVHKGVPIKDVPPYVLTPRGCTALLDAIGRGINETGARLSAMTEDDRPGLVVFVILTDGNENSSKEFSSDKIKEMIKTQTDAYQWQFTYLGANQDAFAVGGGIGVQAGGVLAFSGGNIRSAYAAAASNVGRMRSATSRGLAPQNAYTDEEIKSSQ